MTKGAIQARRRNARSSRGSKPPSSKPAQDEFGSEASRSLPPPLRDLGPAGAQQVLRVFRRHLGRTVRADVEQPAREGLHAARAARGAQANRNAFSSVAGRFEDAP